MHPYLSLLETNSAGSLGEDQVVKLAKIVKWRKITASILIVCFGLLTVGTTIPLLTGDLDIPLFWVFDGLYIVGFVWGIVLLVVQMRNTQVLSRQSVHLVEGSPTKVNRAVAIPDVPGANGAMLLKHLKVGVVKIDGKTYGSLPGLYTAIKDQSPAEFHIVDLRFAGIDGVIVNYL